MNQNENQLANQGNLDYDELEKRLDAELEANFSDLKTLENDYKQIGDPGSLGEVVKNVVWEQFLNQIGVQGGKDFIKANNGLNLDLSKDAHIQTTENFEKGKIATHNTKINYQERYDKWQENFQHDANGNVITHKTRSGSNEATLANSKAVREKFDRNRPTGSTLRNTDMDHTVSAAEITRDPAAHAHMTEQEMVDFANSKANLNEIPSSHNRSKGDKAMNDWLNKPNSKGQKPKEQFADPLSQDYLDDDLEKKYLEKDKEARREYKKQKEKGEKRSVETGNRSRKEEAFRIGGSALKAAVMALLADFVKSMIQGLVQWLTSAQKSLSSLLDKMKKEVKQFVFNLKERLFNAGNALLTTIFTAIIGPVVGTIKKAWIFIKQGYKSIKDAVAFLKNPQNKNMPFSLKLMNVGKIIIAGLTAGGAIILGEVIEKGLMTIPVFNIEIPLLGSLANILGLFLGALVSGIIGAIALNLINKAIANKQKALNKEQQFEKKNEILGLQNKAIVVAETQFEHAKDNFTSNTKQRHEEAEAIIRQSLQNTIDNVKSANSSPVADNKEEFDKLFDELDKL